MTAFWDACKFVAVARRTTEIFIPTAYIYAMSDTEIDLKTAARRALLGRCPCCGKGKLMRSYLKQVENCAACGESWTTDSSPS